MYADHPVALAHAQAAEHPREPRCLVEELAVRVGAFEPVTGES